MEIKANFRSARRSRYFLPVVILMLASLVVGVYAATQLNIAGTGSVTIASTANLFVSMQGTTNPTTNCPTVTTPAYTDTGVTITVTVPQNAAQTQYACIKNTGTSDTLGISLSGTLPSGVIFTSTGSGTVLATGAFAPVSFTFSATSTATLGSFSFTINIT